RSDSVTLYVVRASGEVEVTGHLIGDSGSTSADVVEATERSRLICTVRQGSRVKGAVWLTSGEAHAFTDGHQDLLEAVGDLITLALYHDTVRTTELRRRERIDALVRLLHTVAETLDIRQIFPQLSETVRGALPHDILALTSWAEDGLVPRLRDGRRRDSGRRLLGTDAAAARRTDAPRPQGLHHPRRQQRGRGGNGSRKAA